MRKIFSFVAVFLLAITFVSAKDEVFEGYEGLEWGSSSKTVEKKYPGLKRERSGDLSENEIIFGYESQNITRYFRFFNDKLYWVRVIYQNASQSTLDSLCDKLSEKYGNLLSMDTRGDEDIKFGYYWYIHGKDIFVSIDVYNVRNGYGTKIDEVIRVTYSSAKIRGEMRGEVEL